MLADRASHGEYANGTGRQTDGQLARRQAVTLHLTYVNSQNGQEGQTVL